MVTRRPPLRPGVLRLGDYPDRDPKTGVPLHGRHQGTLTNRRVAGEPAHPFVVEDVELCRVAQRPVRPDNLVERAPCSFKPGFQVAQALARLFLDRSADDLAGVRIDRPYRRDIDHASGRDRPAVPDSGSGCSGRRKRLSGDPSPLPLAGRAWSRGVLGRDAEFPGRQLDPVGLELPHERRPDPGRLEYPLDLSVSYTGLLEGEDVLGEDFVVFDPVDLGDVDDLAGAILEAGCMDDQVDGGGDLFADRPQRQLISGHEYHRFESAEHVRWTVCVPGG